MRCQALVAPPTLVATLLCLALAPACGDDSRETTDSLTSVSITGGGLTNSGVTAGNTSGITSSPGSDSGAATGSTTNTSASTTDNASSVSDSSDSSNSSPSTTNPGTGPECEDDSDCPGGQQCAWLENVCIDADACLSDQDCEPGTVCEDGACVIGGDCGAQGFELEAVPPNLMIVLDRSGSMDGDVQGSNKNRWEVAKDAIKQVTQTYDADIRFGLVTFSGCDFFNECSPGEIIHPPQPNNAGAINSFLDPKGFLYLCNTGNPETSTGNTLLELVGYPLLQDPSRSNAVLLLTDGNENSECKDNTDGTMAAAALHAQEQPVKTFAVGFSDGIIGSLADIATAGGTGQPYNATNPQELEAAMQQIAQTVASCDFILNDTPPDEDKVYVFFDDMEPGIPNDADNGWTYDPDTNTLKFHGEACDAIKNGEVADIDVVYGCNLPIPG